MINNLKKIVLVLLPALMLLTACDDEVSYSDMKEKERDAVKAFIKEQGINVISYEEFIKNDSVTDYERNEYVLIDDVYMQIVRNPKEASDARKIKEGESINLLARYVEYNISSGDTISGNLYDTDNPDLMKITLNKGVYSGTFKSGYMQSIYGSSVPTGWLTPLPYIYLTRHQSQLAKVNLIVPHTKGTIEASNYVYPCFYQIIFQPERLYDTD